jgi:hypothetical protein
MALKKIDKETAIKLILDKKKQGIDEKTILKYFLDNFSFTEPTYYNWKKEALKRFSTFAGVIEAKELEAVGELAKAGILTKLERQKILSDIAIGDVTHLKEVATKFGVETLTVYPTWNDRRTAIAELNKMDGSYIIDPDTENEFKGFEIDEI